MATATVNALFTDGNRSMAESSAITPAQSTAASPFDNNLAGIAESLRELAEGVTNHAIDLESMIPAHAAVCYQSKSGEFVDADKLRIGLEIIADDIDMAELCAREEGDIELAEALNAIFHDVDGLIPDCRTPEQKTADEHTAVEGGRHE